MKQLQKKITLGKTTLFLLTSIDQQKIKAGRDLVLTREPVSCKELCYPQTQQAIKVQQ
jgi:hypothetical protein